MKARSRSSCAERISGWGYRLLTKRGIVRLLTHVIGLQAYLHDARIGQRGERERPASPAWDDAAHPCIGLVPTMGALHRGHHSLIERARHDCDIVIVSIFVNPLQFGPNEDFGQYPRQLDRDCAQCEELGVDVVFAPTSAELYGTPDTAAEHYTRVLPPTALTTGLCGRSRPGHFTGVATVVTKLLSLIQPDRAYFGQKDAQQLAIIRQITRQLNVAVKIIGCPIMRESDGLAYSSRNRYLTPTQRQQAPQLFKSLHQAKQLVLQQGITQRQPLLDSITNALASTPNLQVDYVELVHPDTMESLDTIEEVGLLAIAAYLGDTRLIDNLVVRRRRPIVAIDGPAGAGKSTVARQVAHQLNLLYLDTGAMYRAVTWLALQSGVDLHDRPQIAELVSQCHIELQPGQVADTGATGQIPPSRVWVNQTEVTQAIRTAEVTANVSTIAAQPLVRQELSRRQQSYGREGGVVMEGRDIGTHVFPDAELKIFLTASVQERARRRQQDLRDQNQPPIDLEKLEQMIYERDRKDSTRDTAPLRQAADALEIQTDRLSIEEVTAKIVALYHQTVQAG